MICRTCNGSGHFYTPPSEWWPCPACGGDGVRVLYGPPTIPQRKRKVKR